MTHSVPSNQLPWLADIQLIATDVDGTITEHGLLRPALLQAFEQLQSAGIRILITTGRSAGWVQGLAYYLPITGAMAENGGVSVPAVEGDIPSKPFQLLSLADDQTVEWHRQGLQHMFTILQQRFSGLQEALDNQFRLTDWTFEQNEFSVETLEAMQRCCRDHGWGFIYSTVQCHIHLLTQNKGHGLSTFLKSTDWGLNTTQVMTIGDSPNDSSMFNPDQFPHSVGVASIAKYSDEIDHLPSHVTAASEVWGFCEMARALLRQRDIEPLF